MRLTSKISCVIIDEGGNLKLILDEHVPDIEFANCLASECGLEMSESMPLGTTHLAWRKGLLEARIATSKDDFQQFSFDFVSDLKYHFSRHYAIKKEPLAKALGLKGNVSTSVIDATCGTGKDAMLMLSFGASVVAFERNRTVWALLKDALRRAKQSEYASALENFKLVYGDPTIIESEKLESADVVFLDPMYPHKTKTALPRKEMVLFRELVGDDEDSENLLNWALKFARSRVVVKRPLKGDNLLPGVTASFSGKSTRYDMYSVKSLKN